jgi:hypothetical protein
VKKWFLLLALVLVGCPSPARDYVLADAAAWKHYDEGGWLDRKIDEESSWDKDKKTALHKLNEGRRARISHAIAEVSTKGETQ